jgi:hypothetical protein
VTLIETAAAAGIDSAVEATTVLATVRKMAV